MANYQSIPLNTEMGSGIDQLSSETKVPDGFSEFLRNFDATPEGTLRKRPGYSLYSGGIPVRVESIDYSGTQISFYLDASVDISSLDLSKERSSPLLIYGRTLNAQPDGDFTNQDSLHWYSGFSSDPKLRFQPGTSSLVLTGETHGQGPILSIGTALSTSTIDNSNVVVLPDSVSVDSVTSNVTVSYTNGTGISQPIFVYAKSRAVTPGTNYVTTSAVPAGDSSFSVTAGMHGLANFNLVTEVYSVSGTVSTRVVPDSVVISNTGTVTFGFTGVTTGFTAQVIIYSVSPLNKVTGSAAPGTTQSVLISNLASSFLFPGIYLEDTGTGDLSLVYPDSVVVNDTDATAEITFVNDGTSANFVIYYDTGIVTSNRLTVEGSAITTPLVDEPVQLSIWGLLHREIYASYADSKRPGWVTHLDNYRSELEERLVSGLGGNLFGSYTQAEVGSVYGLPTYYPYLSERVGAETTLAPAFTEGSSARTRGYVSFVGGDEGWAKIKSVEYLTADLVRYTLNCPSLVISGTLSSIVTNSDTLSVNDCAYSQNNGNFLVQGITQSGVDELEILVASSPAQDSSDWNEFGGDASAGVFTDSIPFFSLNPFIPGDRLDSDLWGQETEWVVSKCASMSVIISGVDRETVLPAGLRVVGERTSRIIPIRQLDGSTTVNNLVRGDTIQYSEYERRIRVSYVNAFTPLPVSFTQADGVITVTLTSGDTSALAVGQQVLFVRSQDMTGEWTVLDILGDTQFTIAGSYDLGNAGTLDSLSVQVDEALPWRDTVGSSVSLTVERRWIPIEAPVAPFPKVNYRYFTSDGYASQSFLRSVISKDSLFLTNRKDPIYKFDGSTSYRAGLPRHQVLTYVTVDSAALARIEINNPDVTVAAVNNNVLSVAYGDEFSFTAGDQVRFSSSAGTQDYSVERIYQVATGTPTGYVVLQAFGAIPVGTGMSIQKLSVYRYYGRLNAIDSNGNVVASAAAGAEDYRVQLSSSAAINHKFLVPPSWDVYDFARIEAQVYRTRENGQAPFYFLASIQVPYGQRYIDFTDSRTDDTLLDLDVVNSALLGVEIGQTFSHPLQAKCITSASNRLILGNVKSWPYISLLVGDVGKRIDADTLDSASFLIRKDDTDTLLTSNTTDRIGFELLSSGETTIAPAAVVAVDAGGIATVTSANTLIAGSWVYLFHSDVTDGDTLGLSGYYQILTASGTQFTFDLGVPNYVPLATDANSVLTSTIPGYLPVWLGVDGNYSTLGGNVPDGLSAQQVAMRRAADALNASQSKLLDNAWLFAYAGGEYRYGELFLDFSKVLVNEAAMPVTPEIVLPDYDTSAYRLFVNEVLRAPEAQASAVASLYPSRLLISMPSYPEIFDSPTSALDTDSLSAIDVNREDGQEITAVIPFFGESAFGAAQKDGILLVFKANSIYVVNVNQKAAGQPCVQKLDSRGLGCTSPYSVAPTQNGVMFVNESGIYRVRSDLSVQYLGRKLGRLWNEVDTNKPEEIFGHYSALENKYKVSLSFEEDDLQYANRSFVYDTTREYSADGYRDGSWTSYSNVPSIGYANSLQSSFFASPFGEVFGVRQTGLVSDYRDDSSAIDAEALLRPSDFGDASVRKSVKYVICQFRTQVPSENTELSAAVDLRSNFSVLDSFVVTGTPWPDDGLSGIGSRKVETVRFSVPTTKGVYHQLKLTNDGYDEQVELTGVTYRLTGLNSRGTTEAADTK